MNFGFSGIQTNQLSNFPVPTVTSGSRIFALNDSERQKFMYERSKLFPVPEEFLREAKKKARKAINKANKKVRNVFTKLRVKNHEKAIDFIYGKDGGNEKHLTSRECENFIQTIEPKVEHYLKILSSQIMSCANDGVFEEMEAFIESTEKWSSELRRFVKKRYNEHIEFIRTTKEKLDSIYFHRISLMAQNSSMMDEEGPNAFKEHEYLEKEQQETAKKIRKLYKEVDKVLEKDEQSFVKLNKKTEKLFQQSMKGRGRSDDESSSSSNSSDSSSRSDSD